MNLVARVARHQPRFSGFLKHSDVNAKGVTVPLPSLVDIGDADADLLNAADEFSHGTKMIHVSNRLVCQWVVLSTGSVGNLWPGWP